MKLSIFLLYFLQFCIFTLCILNVRSQEVSLFHKEKDSLYVQSVKRFKLLPNQSLYNRIPSRPNQITFHSLEEPLTIEEKKDSLLKDAQKMVRKLIDSIQCGELIKRYIIIYANNRQINGKWLVYQFDSIRPHDAVVYDISHNYPPTIGDSLFYTQEFKEWLKAFPLQPNQAFNTVFDNNHEKMELEVINYLDPDVINSRQDFLYESSRKLCLGMAKQVALLQPGLFRIKARFVDIFGLQADRIIEWGVRLKSQKELLEILRNYETEHN